jgi:hypothetical protein
MLEDSGPVFLDGVLRRIVGQCTGVPLVEHRV